MLQPGASPTDASFTRARSPPRPPARAASRRQRTPASRCSVLSCPALRPTVPSTAPARQPAPATVGLAPRYTPAHWRRHQPRLRPSPAHMLTRSPARSLRRTFSFHASVAANHDHDRDDAVARIVGLDKREWHVRRPACISLPLSLALFPLLTLHPSTEPASLASKLAT